MDKLKKKIPRNLLSFLLIFCTVALSLLPLFIYFSTRTTLMDFVRIDLGQNQLGEVYDKGISCTAEFDEKALKSRMPFISDWFFESAFVGGWMEIFKSPRVLSGSDGIRRRYQQAS